MEEVCNSTIPHPAVTVLRHVYQEPGAQPREVALIIYSFHLLAVLCGEN